MIDNPRLTDLRSLRTYLSTHTSAMEGTLRRAASAIGGKGDDQSWVGPAANRWRTDANGKRTHVKAEVDRLISEVDRAIAGCPAKVTVNEAKLYDADRD
ncbi:hypothetical protein [Actinacidiphila reveromycinica]|nr:hypothetical protein [Streptomyces sp. SN-593]